MSGRKRREPTEADGVAVARGRARDIIEPSVLCVLSALLRSIYGTHIQICKGDTSEPGMCDCIVHTRRLYTDH